MKSKNTITLLLMTFSIALLLILQVLWLRNSYEKAFYDLRRETNYIFRNTLFTVRDSLFAKNIKPVTEADRSRGPQISESLQIISRYSGDSITGRIGPSSMQVFVYSGDKKDSIAQAVGRDTLNFKKELKGGSSFIIRLTPDTVSTDSLRILYSKALLTAGIPVPFIIKREHSVPENFQGIRTRINLSPKQILQRQSTFDIKDTIFLDQVRINPISEYSASLVNFNDFILKQIAPQILFSILLTVVTVIAFFVLYRSLRSQQRLMDLKNDFISNVSHELKTPVATVSVALEALKNFHALNDPKRTQEYLDIAQKELNRLTLMTDKILKSAVFESKGITIQQESVDLASIAAQVLDSMKLVFEKHQAQANFSTEGNDFIVEGSTAHLTNVIYNLVDNALKYSPVHPRLSVHIKDNQDKIVFTVQDNGLGIAPEYKKKIFEKFFRVPTGDIHNIKGYGLGLSYVASVIKEHGGTIDVVSEEGKGSTFIIHLPKIHE